MKILEDRILEDGQYIGNGILKVDSFVNHKSVLEFHKRGLPCRITEEDGLESDIRLVIYNVRGQEVVELISDHLHQGHHHRVAMCRGIQL